MAPTLEPGCRLLIEKDYEALCLKGAEIFKTLAQKNIQATGKFSAALSGGATPRKLYESLSREPFKKEIPWELMHLFFSDERCVPPDDPESNYRMIQETLFSRIQIPSGNIHRMKGEMNPENAAAEYEKELGKFFGSLIAFPEFDLVLLGLGPDGHTASLFPDTKALKETNRWTLPNFVDKFNTFRLTLTLPVLNAAKDVLFLVSGDEKAEIVSRVLDAKGDMELLPAQLVRPETGRITWLLDASAARLVSELK